MNSATIVRSITTSTSRFEERADGVVVQRILSTRTQTIADARENTTAFLRLAGNHARPALIDMRIARSLQPGVREYYDDCEYGTMCAAVAFLVASPGSRQISQYYMATKAGTMPLAQFTEEAEAIAWLHRATSDRPTFAGNAAF